MYSVTVRSCSGKFTYNYIDYPLPHTFKFAKYTSFKKFLDFLKSNKISDFSAQLREHHPIRKVDNSSTIAINGIIGGQNRL